VKKIFFYSFLLFLCHSVNASETLVLWKLFQQSAKDSKSANQLFDISKNFTTKDNALLIGYKGVSNMVLCNHLNNPFNKLSHFNEGKKLLDAAIKKDSSLVVLRFFRFSCQIKAPSMLGYNSHIKSDKLFLLEYLNGTFTKPDEKEIALNIKDFMLSYSNLTAEERKKLNSIS